MSPRPNDMSRLKVCITAAVVAVGVTLAVGLATGWIWK